MNASEAGAAPSSRSTLATMPADVRTVGFSLAYSLATAIFGGLMPVVSTWLIEVTGDKAAPGWWMAFAAACGLLAALLIYRRPRAGARAVAT